MSGQLTFTAEERLLISTLEYDLQRLEHDPERLFTVWVLQPTYRKAYLDYLRQHVPAFQEGFEALYRLTPKPTAEEVSEPLDWQLPDTYLTALDGFRTRWKLPEGLSREITFTFYLWHCGVEVNGVYAVGKERIEAFRNSIQERVYPLIDTAMQDIESSGQLEQLATAFILAKFFPRMLENNHVQSYLQVLGLGRLAHEKTQSYEAHFESLFSSVCEQAMQRTLSLLPQGCESLWWERAVGVCEQLEKILPKWTPLYRKHARHLDPEYAKRVAQQVYLHVLEGWEFGKIQSNRFPQHEETTISRSTKQAMRILGMTQ